VSCVNVSRRSIDRRAKGDQAVRRNRRRKFPAISRAEAAEDGARKICSPDVAVYSIHCKSLAVPGELTVAISGGRANLANYFSLAVAPQQARIVGRSTG
jgi:hypothetical protein